MQLSQYPRPPADTGWGFHDSAGVDCRPGDAAGYARYLRQELGVTWFKLLVRGTNKVDLARAFTQQGIEVIVRLYSPQPHPHYTVSEADVRAYVDAGAHYFEWGNEPNLAHEWQRASWDEGARVDKVCQQFLRNAEVIRRAGGIPLLPALSPGGDYPHRDWYRTTFEWLRQHGHLSVLEDAALAIHNRPLNHPLTYSDNTGDGCYFLDYAWISDLVKTYLGQPLPLLATEAGYEPGWNQDPRYPEIDPQRHATYNIEILRGFRDRRWSDELFCQCMWLVDSFGHHDFADAAWHNNRRWAGGGDLPAVEAMRSEWAARPFVRRFSWEKASEPPSHALGPDPSVGYYHSSRHGYEPEWIILHDTEGPASAALAWWRSPSNPYKSSAHYLVTSDSKVVAVVPEHLSAHHAGGGKWPGIPEGSTGGTSNINHVSIGVELEYPAAPASPSWPTVQLAAAVKLVREIAQRYSVPRERVLRHADVDPGRKTDPRNLDWEGFLDLVFGEDKVDEVNLEQIRNAAWRALNIPYNPDAAFPRYAREHNLGNPVTAEVDAGEYRLQGFSGGIVYARIGDWGNCKHVSW